MKCPSCGYSNPAETRYCGGCGKELPRPETDVRASVTKTYQTAPDRLERGSVFAGRYEVIEELGRGGMGRVYKVYDTKIKDNIALKLLKPEIASDDQTIERFRNEIKNARKIGHRHVCRMYDLGEEGLTYFITMEYVPGEDLKSFIRRSGHINEAKAVLLAKQICQGLAEAHHWGVIHRDLKPQNIMIDREGNAKIMDFGISRTTSGPGITETGVIIGTPEYMSPEQVEAGETDQRSDIYALGVILYEMTTGHVPFEGETPLSIAIKHKSEPPQNPRELNSRISEALSQIILKCLEKSKDKRYQKAEELLAGMSRIENSYPAAERIGPKRKPITTKEFTVKFSLKKLLVPALVAVIAVLAIVLVRERSPKREAPEVASGEARPPGADIEAVRRSVEAALKTPREGKNSDTGKLIALLGPWLKEASKYLKKEDLSKLEKSLTEIRDKLPREGAFISMWSEIQSQIEEGKRQHDAGDIEASQKSYTKSETKMRKLLDLVNARDGADRAKAGMNEAKEKAAGGRAKGAGNLLFWIASEKERDARDAYDKSDFSSAAILYGILKDVYLLSHTHKSDEDGLRALRRLAAARRAAADAVKIQIQDTWLYDRAREQESQADAAFAQKDYGGAAEYFVLAAFLFEKTKEVALDSPQAASRG